MNWPSLHDPRGLAGMSLPPAPVPSDAPELFRRGVPPPGYESTATLGCNAHRVQLAGGALNTLLVHPEVTPFEQLYRRKPGPEIYAPTVSPESPVAFELGAFRVPATFDLLLFDLRADLYRFSGADPFDTVPVEARRFSNALGFQIAIDGRQPGQIQFQLNPPPPQTYQQAFSRPGIAPNAGLPTTLINGFGAPDTSQFALAAAGAAASASGAGQSLLPQRPTRYGALSVPFTLYVRAGQTFQVRAVVFEQIGSPIACFEYDIAGMLVPSLWISTMTECMKPLTNASGGPGSMGGGPR